MMNEERREKGKEKEAWECMREEGKHIKEILLDVDKI